VLSEKPLKSCLEGYPSEWWMMHLFSCESPSLELTFCYPSLNLGVTISSGKDQPPSTGGFLDFTQSALSLKSALVLCLRQVPVTLTQPLGCLGLQGNILTLVCAQSCPGHAGVCYKGPFPVLLSDSQCWVGPGMAISPL
jgi:hypothetical protein